MTGDVTQLHQVLMNLCVNARDAMPEGGILTLSAEDVELDETYARMHIEARPVRYAALKVEDPRRDGPRNRREDIRPVFHNQGTRQRARVWPFHSTFNRKKSWRFHQRL